ncbi:MAG: M6 family metalloprotease domain-containing protein, partial [Paludibacteraceae bacterium]
MKKIALLAVGCMVATLSWAKPARRGALVVTQEDGTEVIVYQHGDERFHWTTNEAGEWIAQDVNGKWQRVPSLTDEQIQARRETSKFAIAEQAHMRKQAATQTASETNIAEHGLVILVNFTDMAFSATQAEMDSMHNGYNYSRDYSFTYNRETYKIHAEGSARQYFYDASFGQYNPKFDVVGPVTLNQKYSYYGANDSYGNDLHAEQMVYEACLLVDSLYPEINFSTYDNDGDGEMDYVYVVYAGFGEADGGPANTIWPHSYWLKYAGYNLTIDGVKIDKYACGNEKNAISKQHDGIGTFVHEFSHVLGFPDLYATSDKLTHRTLGDWDVMDYGTYNNDGNNPPTYSAYERFFFGWLTPTLITDTALLTLHDIYTTNEAFLITTSDQHNMKGTDPNPTTFYLLENRQSNIWDKYLAGHGMMLTKVQYDYNKWYQNTVNNTASKLGVDIIEAKTNTSSTNKDTDLFPIGATECTEIKSHPIYEIQE